MKKVKGCRSSSTVCFAYSQAMDRIDKIISHTLFMECLTENKTAEEDRIFCRHDMTHFLDVARIGTIIAMEEGLTIDRELIYGAALLHDIGKHRQYKAGVPHEQASAEIAPRILSDCGFTKEETAVITEAILAHRDAASALEKNLLGVLYRADKLSRPCFSCPASRECSWQESKKNLKICY